MTTTTSIETTTRKIAQSSAGFVPVMAVPKSVPVMNGVHSSSSNANPVPGPSTSSTVSTLRSLYPRAAHALLQRDFSLTQALLESAFELLTPPAGVGSVSDALDLHRRKWEILRITLETSAYASPPAGKHVGSDDVLPASLRANLMLSSAGLITALHSRAVRTFTPKQEHTKATFLPAQILVPLVLSSMKLECPEVGRSMIEDWLAQRDPASNLRTDAGGYERLLELYCLHVLPRLHEWEYVEEYLKYESELPEAVRERFKTILNTFRIQEIEAARTIPSPPPDASYQSPSTSNRRTPSPSPSLESNSSSDTDDTHSTHTVVPTSSRGKLGMNGLTPLPATSSTSVDSSSTSKHANGSALRTASPASTVRCILSPSVSRQGTVNRRAPTSVTAHAMSVIRAYVAQIGPLRFLFALLCVVLPVFSFFVRFRRQRQRQSAATPSTDVDAVRRRLVGLPRRGVLSTLWAEVVRAVSDAVRMAGGGLV